MATSGSNYSAFWRHRLICRWSINGQDIANNRSTVTGVLEFQSMDAYGAIYAQAKGEASVTLNGQKQTEQQDAGIGAYQTKLLLAKDYVVPHENNGTKTFPIQGQFRVNVTFAGAYIDTAYVGVYYGTLNTIPRHSSLNAVPNSTLPAAPTFTIARKNSSFNHKLELWAEKQVNPTLTNDAHWTHIATVNNVGTSGSFSLSAANVSAVINSAFRNNKVSGSLGKMKLWTNGVSGLSQQRTFNWYLPTRAKASGGSFTLAVGQQIKGTLSNFNGNTNFSYQLIWQFAGYSLTLATNHKSANFAYTLKQADVDAMTKILANAKSGWGQVRVWSKFNNTPYGENGVQGGRIDAYVVEKDAKPTLAGTPTTTDSVAASVAITGDNQTALQGVSKIQVKTPANFATSKQSATIKTISVTHGGVTTSANYVAGGQTLTLNPPTSTSATTLTITVTDSRGYTASWSKNVPVYAYSAPKVGYSVSRKNNFETETHLVLSSEWSPIPIAGVNKNTLKAVTVRVKKVTDATYGVPVSVPNTTAANKITSVTPFVLTLDNEAKWDVEVAITDSLNTSYQKATVLAGAPIMFLDAEGKSAMFGGLPEKRSPLGAVEIKGDLYHTGTKTGIQMNNSDISGVNALWFSTDRMDNDGEGLHFLKSGKAANSVNKADFDYLYMRDGSIYINNDSYPIIETTGHGTMQQRELWTGGWWMNAAQTAKPTKPLSKCRNGWILVFAKYVGGVATISADVGTVYVPKSLMFATASRGIRAVYGGTGDIVEQKYLYISDTAIGGNAANGNSIGKVSIMTKVYEW